MTYLCIFDHNNGRCLIRRMSDLDLDDYNVEEYIDEHFPDMEWMTTNILDIQ